MSDYAGLGQERPRASLSSPGNIHGGNDFLSRLYPDDRARLANELHMVPVKVGQILVDGGTMPPYLYFPVSGAAAIVIEIGARQLAVGLVGREGFVHPSLALGLAPTPCTVRVEFEGRAFRIPRDRFQRAVDASASLRRLCLLYREAEAIQSYYSAMAYSHRTERTLARWLLMCHDRVDGDELILIHDNLAALMAIRRPTITNGLHVLEGRRLIVSKRGVVRIIDRVGLELHAGGTYGTAERERIRLLERHDEGAPHCSAPTRARC